MFRKLISSLPFSPSLIYQLAAYSKHLKTESRIRTVGLLFVSVAVSLQLIGYLLLPYTAATSTHAKSPSEVLGVSTAAAAAGYTQSLTASRPDNTAASPAISWWQLNIPAAEGLFISVLFLLTTAFFCMRDRLLSKELDLIKADFTSGGGV